MIPQQQQEPKRGCAKCLLGTMSLVFIIVGLAMVGVSSWALIATQFGASTLLTGWSLASVWSIMIVGAVLFVLSIIVWVSACKPTAVCSKIVLVIFSIFMGLIFILNMLLLVVGIMWVNGGMIASEAFNDTVSEVEAACCGHTINDTDVYNVTDICDHIFTNSDCASSDNFYTAIVTAVSHVLKWLAGFLGVDAFLNLVALVCACVLICTKKYRTNNALYKPAQE